MVSAEWIYSWQGHWMNGGLEYSGLWVKINGEAQGDDGSASKSTCCQAW